MSIIFALHYRPFIHTISINQSKFIHCTFKIPTQRPSGKRQSREGGGIENKHHLRGALDLLEVHSRLFGRKRTGLHCRRADKLDQRMDHQITVNRGPQCMTACTRRERAAKIRCKPPNFEALRTQGIEPITEPPRPTNKVLEL